MRDYVIFTDSACDIKPEILASWGVEHKPLTFQFEDDGVEHADGSVELSAFYDRMRAGGVARTSAINVGTFLDAFEALLREGKDILYLGFSSGLSTTYNSAAMAAQQLLEKYPDSKILTVDTLAASAGQGLLVYLTVQRKLAGATVEQAAEFAEQTKLKICHWVTLDDLVYLKRGGRISSTAAFVGNMLGIKPIIHVDNEGHLVSVGKARGHKKALQTLVDRYGELAEDPTGGTLYACNSMCMDDVRQIEQMLMERYGVKFEIVTDIGAVIGAHTGPGTVSIFFVGKER